MLSKSALCLALAAPMTVLLHGCGSDDSTTAAPASTAAPTPENSSTPTPSSSPAGSSTTIANATTAPPMLTTTAGNASTPVPPGPSPGPPTPWDPETAVSTLNAMYMDFDETNDASKLGVTISMAAQPTSLNDNLYCAPLMNTSCHEGQADCRMSTTLFNHKIVVDANANAFAPTMSRPVGYVFNQDMVENTFGKCSYLWDGANFNNLNGGCGGGIAGGCDDELSAFANQCTHDPAEPHTCTRDDFEITSMMCKCEPPLCSETYGSADPPATAAGATCFYEMPALIYGDSTQTSHLRDAVKQRVALQANDNALSSEWNEVVLDNHLLIPSIQSDPTNTILAFVCIPSANPDACEMASQMRDDYHQTYGVTGTGVPVVAIDTTLDFTVSGGPFTLADTFIFA